MDDAAVNENFNKIKIWGVKDEETTKCILPMLNKIMATTSSHSDPLESTEKLQRKARFTGKLVASNTGTRVPAQLPWYLGLKSIVAQNHLFNHFKNWYHRTRPTAVLFWKKYQVKLTIICLLTSKSGTTVPNPLLWYSGKIWSEAHNHLSAHLKHWYHSTKPTDVVFWKKY